MIKGWYIYKDLSGNRKNYSFIWKDENSEEGLFNVIGIDNIPEDIKWIKLSKTIFTKRSDKIHELDVVNLPINQRFIVVCNYSSAYIDFDKKEYAEQYIKGSNSCYLKFNYKDNQTNDNFKLYLDF